MAAEGAIVAIVGRKAVDNQIVVDKIKAKKGKAFSVEAELTKPKDCQKAVEKVAKKYGRIDGLVNNAGVNDGVGLEHGSYDSFVNAFRNPKLNMYIFY